jgi:chaperone modulatory protein CbpM
MNGQQQFPACNTTVLEDQTGLGLMDISWACAVHAEAIVELVEEGILSPLGHAPHCWRFNGVHVRRAAMVLRLQRDLGLNLAGAALAVQLLDELAVLRARLAVQGSGGRGPDPFLSVLPPVSVPPVSDACCESSEPVGAGV